MTDAQPPLIEISRAETHRLVPRRYLDDDASVLADLADSPEDLQHIFDLDESVNDRITDLHYPPGLDRRELVHGVPQEHAINAAFCHASDSRFSGTDRGAWYAAWELETSIAEISFHRRLLYQEMDPVPAEDQVVYSDLMAGFMARFADIRGPGFEAVLRPDRDYRGSQAFAARLRANGTSGIVYPSVRRTGGTCLACFVPGQVQNVRRGESVIAEWNGSDISVKPTSSRSPNPRR